jgi:hypothetical protein
MVNRRSYSRVPADGFVDIRIVDKNEGISGIIEQISREGVGIYTKGKIRPGSKVVLELLCFAGPDRLILSISGTVKSCQGLASPIKKENELGVVTIKFDQEMNPAELRLSLS